MDPKLLRVHPQQALAVYAESLAAGGTVALFGDASLGLGARLVDLGARDVHVWDPDPRRARIEAEHARDGVTVRAYDTPGSRPRSVDLVIVPDLGLFEDAPGLVSRARELVGEEGVLLAGAANRDVATGEGVRVFEYYELFDLVAKHFSAITMIAELPFHGVALVTLGEESESSGVSVDTQLAAGEARVAERFVVVASQRDVVLEPYTVVELPPPREAQETEIDAAPPAPSERAEALEALLRDRDRQISELSSQLEHQRSMVALAGTAAADALEAARRAESTEARARAFERELFQLTEANASEIRRFEDMLRERAQATRSLETELARRDQMVRELVGTLEEGLAGPSPETSTSRVDEEVAEENARLRELLDTLALDVARREADARATAWTVSELERRLER